jgi:folate-binding protein YgfZ
MMPTARRSRLFESLRDAKAQWMELDGWEIPASFASVEEEYWALKESASLLDLSHRGRLLVRGRDAPRFLHGMVTNEVKAMEVGRGNYAFFLDVHGRILADARILRLGPQAYLVDCEPRCIEAIRQTLRKHIIADQVVVEDAGAPEACLAVEGPCALEVLRDAIGFDPPHMLPLEHLELPDDPLRIVRASISGQIGYWILASAERLARVWDQGRRAGAALGARPVGFAATEICRIEAGLPRHGADMDEKTLPQETGQMHAISFTKGCYLGQEIVERIRSRGQVHRRLVGLLFEGKQDARAGMEIRAGDQGIGNVTSAAYSFGLRRTIALGMVRREFAEPGTSVLAGELAAEVASLPFFYPMARIKD